MSTSVITGLALCAVFVSINGCGSHADDTPEVAAGAIDELVADGLATGPIVLQDSEAGATIHELLARRWLEWAMGLPFSTGPVTDTTGEQCGLGQSGAVWMLAGTTGGSVTRSCTIPEHKAIYLPLVNHWMIPPAQYVDAPEELADFLAFAEYYFPAVRDATCSLTLRLDGEDLFASTEEMDAALWADVYDPFKITLDDDNYFGPSRPGGTQPAALTAGHYALLTPLSPGEHTLELGGALCDGDEVFFETSAVYHLHVGD